MKTTTLAPARTFAEQRARIRFAAARAAIALKQAHDPLLTHITEAEQYHRRLNGEN